MPSVALTDATAALAWLLCDAGLRARFHVDRNAVLDALRVPASERESLQRLDSADLERQADALIAKRVGEVARLLPGTFARGGQELRERFAAHAQAFWPAGHRRHLLDAVRFGAHLADIRHPALLAPELNRVRFRLAGRRFALFWCARPRAGLQLLFGNGRERVRELRLQLCG